MPDGMRCANCGIAAEYATVEAARRRGWRIAWTADGLNWCPSCYNGEPVRRPRRGEPQPYDEPML